MRTKVVSVLPTISSLPRPCLVSCDSHSQPRTARLLQQLLPIKISPVGPQGGLGLADDSTENPVTGGNYIPGQSLQLEVPKSSENQKGGLYPTVFGQQTSGFYPYLSTKGP